jgi:hypothetical protein
MAALIGGERGIRTHEPREGPPVLKSDDSHVSGTHSHAIAIIPEGSCAAETQCFAGFGYPMQLECNLHPLPPARCCPP